MKNKNILLTLGLVFGGGLILRSFAASGKSEKKNDETSAHSQTLLDVVPEAERSAFHSKVIEVASRLGMDPDWLIVLMYFESRLNPAAKNPGSTATGLIQFMAATAKDLGTSTQALAKMSRIEQMFWVEKYLARAIKSAGQPKSIGESYLLIFYPYAIKQPSSYILGSQVSMAKAREIAKANPGFDLDGDGLITKAEVLRYADSLSRG